MKRFFLGAADVVVSSLERMFRGSLSRYIEISTPVDDYTFTTEDGTLITTLRLKGLKEIVGHRELTQIIENLTTKWAPYFATGAHPMKFIYFESPNDIRKRLDTAQEQSRVVAERLELNLKPVFDGRRDINARYCHHEDVFISLGTTKAALSTSVGRAADLERTKRRRELPSIQFSQNPADLVPELLASHRAFVEAIMGDLNSVGTISEKLSITDALIEARKITEPRQTSDDWRPRLMGDRPTMRLPNHDTRDFSTLLYPTIGEQIFPNGGTYSNDHYVVGDTAFGSLYIDIQPRKIPLFAALFNRVRKSEPFPWSIAFDLDGSGNQALNVKIGLTGMLRFSDMSLLAGSPSANRSIVMAGKEMQRLIEQEPSAKLRTCLTTWANKDDANVLKHRMEMLTKAVQGWGECEVKIEKADPADGLVSTLPGTGFHNIGTPAIPPLKDAIRMLPLNRPASPWDSGGILFRTFDGKVWPYQPASSQQESCIDIYVASPRQGKTVLAYLKILAYILNPRNADLPQVVSLDVGDSGLGFTDLLRDALPEHKQKKVIYKKLSMDDSPNVLTPVLLGSRSPTERELESQINYLLQLVIVDPSATPHPDLPGILRSVLKYVYDFLDKQPKPYRKHVNPKIDTAIIEEGIEIDDVTSWWELVDALFDCGRITEAHAAQYQAAPLIHDLISGLKNSESIKHLYSSTLNNNEPLIDWLQRKLIEARTEFPQLSKPTNLDLGDATIKVFNLEDVTGGSGPHGAYRVSVMYLAISHVSCTNWFFDKDDIAMLSDRYKDYHAQRVNRINSGIKYLYFDEVHRTQGAKPIQQQMARYCSETPKKGVSLGFSSQLFEHFNENVLKNATNVHILNSNNKSVIEDAKKYWHLTATEESILRNQITGKSKHGSTIFYIFQTQNGLHKQALQFSASPQEIWSLSATLMDRNLKSAMVARMGRQRAIDALSKAFPSGSAASYIEQRTKELQTDEKTVIESIVKEVSNDQN